MNKVASMIGPLTVERHRALAAEGRHLHVFYKGEDVTLRCSYADDTPGAETATLYRLNEQGKKYSIVAKAEYGDISVVAEEHVYGDIEIREGEPFHVPEA